MSNYSYIDYFGSISSYTYYYQQDYTVVRNAIGTATNILSLGSAKKHLRVDSSDEDDLITSLIAAAVNICENYVGQSFQRTAYRVFTNSFNNKMQLPSKVFASISSITYQDTDNNTVTLDSSDYNYDQYTGLLFFPDTPPSDIYQYTGSPVTFNITCGYDVTNTTEEQELPKALVSAVKLTLGHLYENRQDVTAFEHHKLPQASEWAMNPYRVLKAS